ncbi:hypothetical protein GCM10010185_15520 [Saccharothrix coeruleofusca]|uniref:Uncharacterized protein n=1 Tax=Saccharothrix coeruleofusca TaxID=33919 RepID=A0A918EBZ4_9PSEU|nr:hypothetical protein [Saccharothrix coeruleofusca]GGP44689.1 hypothetical protein GCM10010185_15520 [Saccharothrix coeruleofusca]
MRFGSTRVELAGGRAGCLTALVLSVVASLLLTVLLNLLL